jgi:hypothetical protein
MVSVMVIGVLATILLVGMFAHLTPVQSVTPGPTEPGSLQEIVEYPETATLDDLDESEKPPILDQIESGTEGFFDMLVLLQGKGYHFDNASAKVSWVSVGQAGSVFAGWLLSWWSDMGPNGTRALIVVAFDPSPSGSNIVMGAITNLLPPEQVPGVDPYIIVNAMPYVYITWYWWVWTPVARLHTWHYWWYDSHSHPNWFWGVYWWWRTDVEYYWLKGGPYVSWWWFFWHWTYWRHWHWWSTYFPY